MERNQQGRAARGRSMAIGAGVTFALVIGLFAATALATRNQEQSGGGGAERDVPAWAYDVPATPEGMTPVSGPEGQIVGFIADADLDAVRDRGEPPLGVSAAGIELAGLRVWGEDGNLAGYFLSGDAGFVSLEQASDAAVFAAIAEHWAEERTTAEQPPPADLAAKVPGS